MQAENNKTIEGGRNAQLKSLAGMLTSLEGDIAETYGLAPSRKYFFSPICGVAFWSRRM